MVPKSSLLSSVNRLFIIGLMPSSQENYRNIKLLMDQLKLGTLKGLSFSCDMKMVLLMAKGAYGSSRHSCVFGDGSSPWIQQCVEMTIGDLKKWHQKFLEAGERAEAKHFMNCVEETLLPYSDETLISDVINIMELHILLGVTLKLVDYIKAVVSKEWVDNIIKKELNISYSYSNGRETLNGNACHKILKGAETFMMKAMLLPDSCSINEVLMAVECLGLFEEVIHTCFGVEIKGDYKLAIKEFCLRFRALPRMNFSPKFHIVEQHIIPYLERRHNMVRLFLYFLISIVYISDLHPHTLNITLFQCEDYEGKGLGFWSEQSFEACHHEFDEFWKKRNVGPDHALYGEKLLEAVLDWNGRRI